MCDGIDFEKDKNGHLKKQLKKKIFDIMFAKLTKTERTMLIQESIKKPKLEIFDADSFLAAMPHAAKALKLIEQIDDGNAQDQTPARTQKNIKNEFESLCELLFEKSVSWDSAVYRFKMEYMKKTLSKTKDLQKAANMLGILKGTVRMWQIRIEKKDER